jgi:hypothetical protein
MSPAERIDSGNDSLGATSARPKRLNADVAVSAWSGEALLIPDGPHAAPG